MTRTWNALATMVGVLLLAPGADARTATAPGRVVFGDAPVQRDVGANAGIPVALADGGALLVARDTDAAGGGLTLTHIGPTGRPDTPRHVAFGGRARSVLQVLRRPGGGLLVLVGDLAGTAAGPRIDIVALTPSGTLDTAYGSGGVAATALGVGCSQCTNAALAPDGSVVVAGTSGGGPLQNLPPFLASLRWSVTRMTPAGSVDATFGVGGVATIAPGTGMNAGVRPDGRIVTVGRSGALAGARVALAGLTATGAPDPAFHAGSPVSLPLNAGSAFALGTDGAATVAGQQGGFSPPPDFAPAHAVVARYTAGGAPDPAFGTGGFTDLGTGLAVGQLLPAPGGGLLAVATPTIDLRPGAVAPDTALTELHRLTAAGQRLAVGRVAPAFGGGTSSFLVSVRPRPLPALRQNSFTGHELLPRPDGSMLMVGSVSVVEPTGEGEGRTLRRTAVAALTAAGDPDLRFGGAATPLRARVAVVRQRARTARRRHGIRIRLTVSAPGLCRAVVVSRGRTIARSVLPIFTTGRQTLPVELTHIGNRQLAHARRAGVTVTITTRDLLTGIARATARATLR